MIVDLISREGQTSLATATGVSPSYVNQIANGGKYPSKEWLDLVFSTVRVGEDDRETILREAALDYAESRYKVEL